MARGLAALPMLRSHGDEVGRAGPEPAEINLRRLTFVKYIRSFDFLNDEAAR
jgi:hypothetical protein